jgi:hypothetical protein
MVRFLTFLLAVIGLMAVTASADARNGCGRGWFFNGRACVPERAYYGRRAYAPSPYYGGYYGRPRPMVGANGSVSCGNPNYTFQDGRCKPYRGP